MAKKRPVSTDDIDNMVSAAREMGGALVGMSGQLESTETDMDPRTLRESASALIACARDANHTAILLLSHATRLEMAAQIRALQDGKKD